jgi:predicted AlkP superfamily phosphohydrolase/phosphomutase
VKPRVFLLGLDGVPHSLLLQFIAEGRLPTLAQLVSQGSLVRTNSVLPPISSVAWTSLTTGRNPAGHGIFGFIDRTPNPLKVFIPTTRHMQAARIWDISGKHDKTSLVLNVPATYPPTPLNGLLVGGFESPSLAKATYPAELAAELQQLGYIIDVDPARAGKDKAYLLNTLEEMLQARKRALLHLLPRQDWDLVICHIMGTDRLHHFMWRDWEDNDPQWAAGFLAYYTSLDRVIAEIVASLPSDTVFMAASDHGFCAARKEVQLNLWLKQQGLLSMTKDDSEDIGNIAQSSRLYSMIPGRFYVNMLGRESTGSVFPAEAPQLLAEVGQALRELRDPETGQTIITDVVMRDQAFQGPLLNSAPDMVVLARDGYELKSSFRATELIKPSTMSGMHTYGNAFWLTVGRNIDPAADSILDIAPTILQIMGIDSQGMDKRGSLA